MTDMSSRSVEPDSGRQLRRPWCSAPPPPARCPPETQAANTLVSELQLCPPREPTRKHKEKPCRCLPDCGMGSHFTPSLGFHFLICPDKRATRLPGTRQVLNRSGGEKATWAARRGRSSLSPTSLAGDNERAPHSLSLRVPTSRTRDNCAHFPSSCERLICGAPGPGRGLVRQHFCAGWDGFDRIWGIADPQATGA